MPPLTVRPVASRADYRRFIDFPYRLYRDNRFWVPPLRTDQQKVLDPKKNAFFEHGRIQPFLATDASGETAGRIAAVYNGMHLQKYADGNGFFGFFECVERYDAAEALFDAAAAWLRDQGLTGVRGPASPSLNDTAGLLVEGFDREPAILMPYNPAYYEPFLLQYGFERVKTMWAYYIHKKYTRLDKLRRGVQVLLRRYPKLKLRSLEMKRLDEEAREVLRIYNDAWSDNWGHVPMTEGEFRQLVKELKQIVDPRIVYILEYDGRPVGFSITLPDLNQALIHLRDGRLFPLGLPKLLAQAKLCGIHSCRTPLMGVLKEHQGKGWDAVMHLAILENGPGYGYDASEMSWVLDSNPLMLNAMESMGGVRDKEYAMFEKKL